MIDRWLEDRREGREQSDEDIRAFVDAVVADEVTRAQAAAWLAFVYCRGMTARETVALTQAMTESGRRMSWSGIDGPFWDKHSTGGVGDKVSLVLAPLWAAMGIKVPMLSGRGLGITGGTLDKLEAVPGLRTDLDQAELRGVLQDAGCFINGQTPDLAPADRLLYALRDETGTVASVPLITASILSKKLVEGLDRLVLDVKCGSGAFMQTRESAQALADSLVEVGRGAGLDTVAQITDMDQPLGSAVGNALEVEEALAVLRGEARGAVRALVLALCGDEERGRSLLDSGHALERWERMVRAQGGDPAAPLHGGGCAREDFLAESSGRVVRCDAGLIGRAAFRLGAGRLRAGEPVDHGVGVLVHKHRGDAVHAGEPLATLVHRERAQAEALGLVRRAYEIA